MNLFDILDPIMVDPSSSHTAGAVRIGAMPGILRETGKGGLTATPLRTAICPE